jgi:hypothetical protein
VERRRKDTNPILTYITADHAKRIVRWPVDDLMKYKGTTEEIV